MQKERGLLMTQQLAPFRACLSLDLNYRLFGLFCCRSAEAFGVIVPLRDPISARLELILR